MLHTLVEPAVGVPLRRRNTETFIGPFDLLSECHRRVERTNRLIDRLSEHIECVGLDAGASSAAHDILRYFNKAAPLHHRDEEEDVFPWVEDHGDRAAHVTLQQLKADHRSLDELWQRLSVWLQAVTRHDLAAASSLHPGQGLLSHWQETYSAHIRLEEDFIYPIAVRLIPPLEQAAILDRMRQRRTVR